MTYVIIGNATAAIGAVEGIRQTDQTGEIIIVAAETHHTYSRPMISYLLGGKTDLEKMKYRPDDFYEKNGCTVYLGICAQSVDAEKKTVTLSDSRVLKYDKLLIATGSSAFVPPIAGMNTLNACHTFMTLDDATALLGSVNREKRVLIVGAGLIGLKCAEGLYGTVASITVVDLAPRILSSILDEDAAQMVQAHLEQKGIGFRLSQSVKRFDGEVAELTSGEVLYADIVIMAVGVRANTALLDGIAQIGKGIVINERCQTTHPDIYAAGDCTESRDVTDGNQKVMALLPNAYMQGETAGINMAGGDKVFDKALPMNAIGFLDLHMLTAGSYMGDVFEARTDSTYKKLFYKDNRLCGFILIGDINKAGIYTALIRNQTPLDTLDFDLICHEPSLIAFTKEKREEMLGGAYA